MDIQLTQRSVYINDIIINDSIEQAIDSEFTLPDYCPDVERILKCIVTPKISSVSVTGGSITAQGTAYVNVLYCSKDKGDLRGYEMPISFSKNYDTKADCDKAYLTATVKQDYVNCRAVNERKLDIHGAVSIKIIAVKSKDADVLTNALSDDVQMKKSAFDAIEIAGCAQKQVIINDELELGQSNGSIMSIIKYSADVLFEDCKFITNKAIIKGTLYTNILYCSDDRRYERLSAALPVNQIIDVEGVTDESFPEVRMDVCSCELKPYTNTDGECRSILAVFKVNISVCGYNQYNIDVITDAYSTKYEMNITQLPIMFEKLITNINTEHIAKDTIMLPDESISEVVDMWCCMQSLSSSCENGEMIIEGKINVNIITMDNENSCMYHEKEISFEHRQRLNTDNNAVCDIDAKIRSCSYNITSSNSIDVRCEIALVGKATERLKHTIITNMQANEAHPKLTDNMPALIVYYARAGDSIWNIAMKYNTSPALIAELNRLNTEILPTNKMLLIPSV